MSDEGTTCSINRFDISRFGSSMEFPEVKTPSYVAEPDRPHMFEIRALIYGVVGAFIVIEDPRWGRPNSHKMSRHLAAKQATLDISPVG